LLHQKYIDVLWIWEFEDSQVSVPPEMLEYDLIYAFSSFADIIQPSIFNEN
jgi:hypothetical protein